MSVLLAINQARRAVLGRARERGLVRGRDLPYGPDPEHRVDTWRRPPTISMKAGALPCVVLVHGGGWITGSRRDFVSLAPRFAQAGLLAVAADYRLARPWPAALDDIERLLDGLPALGADPTRVLLWGHSAGGHLALLAASRVAAVVALGAPADLRLLTPDERALATPVFGEMDLATVSPVALARPKGPVLLVHGTADAVCSIEGARALATAWSATLREVPGGDHGLRWPPRECFAARGEAFAWAVQAVST